jgi:hypothetical protein
MQDAVQHNHYNTTPIMLLLVDKAAIVHMANMGNLQ